MPKVVSYNPLAAMAALAAQAGAVQGHQQRSQQGFQNAMQIQQFNNALQQAAANRQMQQQQMNNQMGMDANRLGLQRDSMNQDAFQFAERLAAQQRQQSEENALRQMQLGQQFDIAKLANEGRDQRLQDRLLAAEEQAKAKTATEEQKKQAAIQVLNAMKQGGLIQDDQYQNAMLNLVAGRNIQQAGGSGAGQTQTQYRQQNRMEDIQIRAAKDKIELTNGYYKSLLNNRKYKYARPGSAEEAELNKARDEAFRAQDEYQSLIGSLSQGSMQQAQSGSNPVQSTQHPAQTMTQPSATTKPMTPQSNIPASRKTVIAVARRVGKDSAVVRQALIEMGLNPDLPIVED